MQDATTTIKELKDLVDKFQKERNWDPPARSLAISVALEAAELLEHFQWDDYEEYRKDKKALQKDLAKELADVMVYALAFAEKTRIDVAEAVREKIKHNEKKYPAHLFQRGGVDHYYKIKKRYRKGR